MSPTSRRSCPCGVHHKQSHRDSPTCAQTDVNRLQTNKYQSIPVEQDPLNDVSGHLPLDSWNARCLNADQHLLHCRCNLNSNGHRQHTVSMERHPQPFAVEKNIGDYHHESSDNLGAVSGDERYSQHQFLSRTYFGSSPTAYPRDTQVPNVRMQIRQYEPRHYTVDQ